MCGLVGMWSVRPRDWSQVAYNGLSALRHRGQDGFGFVGWQQKFLHVHQLGEIPTVSPISEMDEMFGVLGHTRYATMGSQQIASLQPMVYQGKHMSVAMAHNGNVVSYIDNVAYIRQQGMEVESDNDIEVLAKIWIHGYEASNATAIMQKMVDATSAVFRQCTGAYSTIGICEYGLIAFRDPEGIRPLVIGYLDEGNTRHYAIASETVAFDAMGYRYLRDIEQGEFVWIDTEGTLHAQSVLRQPMRSCMFEWVYFAHKNSRRYEQSIAQVREQFGLLLAKKIDEHILKSIDVVCAIPSTSVETAMVLAKEIERPYKHIVQAQLSTRSFIASSMAQRNDILQQKFTVEEQVRDSTVLLVDDSLVRGNTVKQVVQLLKIHGVRYVYLAITCPPLRNPCQYGIALHSTDEFIVNQPISVENVLGVEKIVFLDKADVESCLPHVSLCWKCVETR